MSIFRASSYSRGAGGLRRRDAAGARAAARRRPLVAAVWWRSPRHFEARGTACRAGNRAPRQRSKRGVQCMVDVERAQAKKEAAHNQQDAGIELSLEHDRQLQRQ